MEAKKLGIIGSGSWATAIAKIVTDNHHSINWWVRQPANIDYFNKRHHNPHYLRNTYFDVSKINFFSEIKQVIEQSDILVIAVPSIHIEASLNGVDADLLKGKQIVSAVKGVLPKHNVLLHEYLYKAFNFPLAQYFTLLGQIGRAHV